MAILPICPSCGLKSDAIRCPRCNTLKLLGCNGVCSRCGNSCSSEPARPAPTGRPSDDADDDAEHSGTPLSR